MFVSVWHVLTRFGEQLAAHLGLVELLKLLTLALILAGQKYVWYVQIPLNLLAVFALIVPKFRARGELWWFMVLFLAAGIYQTWYEADNHDFLLCYWVAAIALLDGTPAARHCDQTGIAARGLFCAVMFFAVFWKATSPDYLSGAFFDFTLLTDERFSGYTAAMTGLDKDALVENADLLAMLQASFIYTGNDITTVQLNSNPQTSLLAELMTWWTIGIEGVLLIAFALPRRGLLLAARHGLLISFLLSTYSVATVKGFGWQLIILGIAQCQDKREKPFVVLYLICFAAIEIYTAPWSDIFKVGG